MVTGSIEPDFEESIYPMMTEKEVSIIQNILASLGDDVTVFEWGSGASTYFFPKKLEENNIRYNWFSVEYNREWFTKVSSWVSDNKNIHLKLIPEDGNKIELQEKPMAKYVNYPHSLDKKFDLIIIDGRKRRRCLLESLKLVSKNGFVLLHDAQRPYYQCAMRHYPYQKRLSERIWIGAIKKSKFPQSLFDQWSLFYFWSKSQLMRIRRWLILSV